MNDRRLLQLEETVDVHRWQMDLDVAHVRDHEELLSMGQRIENGNAGIHRELEQQGETIAEVLHVLHVNMRPIPVPRLPLVVSSSLADI
jgi:hypothetical protein